MKPLDADEEIVNDLIAVIWPLLDSGMSKSDIRAHVENVIDSWEPDGEQHE